MYKLLRNKFKCMIFILTLISIVNFSTISIAFAEDTGKSNLEKQLEQQEGTIKDDIEDKVIPKSDFSAKDASDFIVNAEYKEFNVEDKKNTIKNLIVTGLIKSRTMVILSYAVFVAGICIYMATMGSRSLNRRRHGLLLLIGNTIFFLIYINVPLMIIYFSMLQEHLNEIEFIDRMIDTMNFITNNSVIISVLLAYLGVSKLIVSKNDLSTRKQGQYLLKASVIVFLILNVLPFGISFIINM